MVVKNDDDSYPTLIFTWTHTPRRKIVLLINSIVPFFPCSSPFFPSPFRSFVLFISFAFQPFGNLSIKTTITSSNTSSFIAKTYNLDGYESPLFPTKYTSQLTKCRVKRKTLLFCRIKKIIRKTLFKRRTKGK